MARHTLRCALGINMADWPQVEDAARDAHMETREYCRLMVLCAAGHAGLLEHAERAINASSAVDQRPGFRVRVERVG